MRGVEFRRLDYGHCLANCWNPGPFALYKRGGIGRAEVTGAGEVASPREPVDRVIDVAELVALG